MDWLKAYEKQEQLNLDLIKNIDRLEKVSGRYSLYGSSGGNDINILEAKQLDDRIIYIKFQNNQHFCVHNDHGNTMYQKVYEGEVMFSGIIKKVKQRKKKNSFVGIQILKKDRKGLLHVKIHLGSSVLEFKCDEVECTDYYIVDDKPKPIARLYL